MLLNRRHSWTLTPKAAIALQQELRRDIVVDRPLDLAAIRLVAGVDVSVKEKHAQAAVVVLTFPKFEIVETVVAQAPVTFPYVPGLLTFREGPVLEAAFAKLAHVPDVFIFDGIGYAHPRRIGLACHMGLLLGRPSVGCGKTRLCGEHAPVPARRGAMKPLVDKGETIGVALRSQSGVAPLFISPGHLADIASSAKLILRCAPRYRLPEPIRAAHRAAGRFEPVA